MLKDTSVNEKFEATNFTYQFKQILLISFCIKNFIKQELLYSNVNYMTSM